MAPTEAPDVPHQGFRIVNECFTAYGILVKPNDTWLVFRVDSRVASFEGKDVHYMKDKCDLLGWRLERVDLETARGMTPTEKEPK